MAPRRYSLVAQLNESITLLIVESVRRIRYSPPTVALPTLEETLSLKCQGACLERVNRGIV